MRLPRRRLRNDAARHAELRLRVGRGRKLRRVLPVREQGTGGRLQKRRNYRSANMKRSRLDDGPRRDDLQ